VLLCFLIWCSVLPCVAICCSVLPCVAVRCSVLQCVAVCCSVLQCIAMCCRALQCVAVCCIVLQYQCAGLRDALQHTATTALQCVAVCCSVLQCVAVCCSTSVLDYVTHCTSADSRESKAVRFRWIPVESHESVKKCVFTSHELHESRTT